MPKNTILNRLNVPKEENMPELYLDADSDNDSTQGEIFKRSYKPEMILESIPDYYVSLLNDVFGDQTQEEQDSIQSSCDEGLSERPCLICDYMAGEIPPVGPFDHIPEEFTAQHSVAYIFLNLFQQANQDGLRETREVVDELDLFFDFENRREIKQTCAEVILWSQRLKPRQLKPSIHSLMWLAKMSLSRDEVAFLFDRMADLAGIHEDIFGNVMAYARWLECFFMEKMVDPKPNPFQDPDTSGSDLPDDPEGWTILHDLSAMMLHFNAIRDQDIDENEKFNFQIYMPNWKSEIDGTGLGAAYDPVSSVQLLEEVDQALFPSEGPMVSDMLRVAQSHENLVRYYWSMALTEAEMKKLFFDLYKATLSELYLTHEQKIQFKRWLLFWNQHMDLSNMIDVIDYRYEEGWSIFSAIDYPEQELQGSSLERFCR